jgi:exopolyphosphatase / guanosine-5'-triphosphate,3'-diphosphate pyrophosphatase
MGGKGAVAILHAEGDPVGEKKPIVARWEWRWVGRQLPDVRAPLGEGVLGPPATTEETYLVSLDSPHNVKTRLGVLDVKRLHRTEPDGLELWFPTMRAVFPVPAEALAEVYGAWGVPIPGMIPPATDAEAFLNDVVPATPAVRRVDLVKHRTRLRAAGCAGELVELEIGGHRWISLAFEHENGEVVRAALRHLGLESGTNLNYPAALKRILALSRSQPD